MMIVIIARLSMKAVRGNDNTTITSLITTSIGSDHYIIQVADSNTNITTFLGIHGDVVKAISKSNGENEDGF
jgi:hypothetical protein